MGGLGLIMLALIYWILSELQSKACLGKSNTLMGDLLGSLYIAPPLKKYGSCSFCPKSEKISCLQSCTRWSMMFLLLFFVGGQCFNLSVALATHFQSPVYIFGHLHNWTWRIFLLTFCLWSRTGTLSWSWDMSALIVLMLRRWSMNSLPLISCTCSRAFGPSH